MNTPTLNHITSMDYEQVYEPAEDSFLLLDALEIDIEYLEMLDPQICLEIGSGSGVIITAFAKKFKNCLCLATDINFKACEITKLTAKYNETNLDVINGNLFDNLKSHSVDVLIFNPPYVVTTDDELNRKEFNEKSGNSKTSSGLVSSWAGGEHGRRVIDKLLEQLDIILSPKGVFYLLLLRENKPDEVVEQLQLRNYKVIRFMERHIPGEYLYIIKISR